MSSANQIILVALYPNATHIIQPCDVTVFGPLKTHWKKAAHAWKFETNNEIVSKVSFPLVFQKAIKSITPETIINGFRKCGLYPWCSDAVDYTKCIRNEAGPPRLEQEEKENLPKRKTHLEYIESFINAKMLEQFKKYREEKFWDGKEQSKDLFDVWMKIKDDKKQSNVESTTVNINRAKDIDHEFIDKNQNNESVPHLDKHSDNMQHEEYLQSEKENIHDFPLPGTSTEYQTPVKRPPSKSLTEIENELNLPSKTASIKHQTPLRPSPVHKFNMHIDESSNSSVGTPFKKALFWPESVSTSKNKRNREKVPSVVTSKEWKRYFTKKEEEKKNKEQEKQDRKKARDLKKLQKLQEKEQNQQKRAELKQKSKKRKVEENSDSDNSEDISYADASSDDPETFSDIETERRECEDEYTEDATDSQTLEPPRVPLLENFYAVYYEEQFYIGRVIKVNSKVLLKFLKEVTENCFIWPKRQDNDWVEMERLFYGPITSFGNEHFHVEDITLKKK